MMQPDQTSAKDEGAARGSPWRFVRDALRRRAERRRLMTLDDRLLRDIGLRHGDAYREYVKPCWRR